MKHYRSRIDIISQILQMTNGAGVTSTKIMYKVFLSYSQIKECLEALTENDLLSYDAHNQTFKTTEKCLRHLDTYNR
jgi:predicted transcriptional regulator